jgi:hypothetical protein
MLSVLAWRCRWILHCCSLTKERGKGGSWTRHEKGGVSITYAFPVFYALYHWHLCASLVLTTLPYLTSNRASRLCLGFQRHWEKYKPANAQ